MANGSFSGLKNKTALVALIGMAIMVVLSLTQLVPSIQLAGIAVFVGVGFFFITEALAKTPKDQSGLRFKTFFADLKKRGVLILALLPVITAILPLAIDHFFMNGEYMAHVLNRSGSIMPYDNVFLSVILLFVLALGEEIAWRGFFLGFSSSRFPFILCAIASSVLFAMGHVDEGKTWIVLYDTALVFIDSMIFSFVFRKSGNCLVSTASHIIGNAVGLFICFVIL